MIYSKSHQRLQPAHGTAHRVSVKGGRRQAPLWRPSCILNSAADTGALRKELSGGQHKPGLLATHGRRRRTGQSPVCSHSHRRAYHHQSQPCITTTSRNTDKLWSPRGAFTYSFRSKPDRKILKRGSLTFSLSFSLPIISTIHLFLCRNNHRPSKGCPCNSNLQEHRETIMNVSTICWEP